MPHRVEEMLADVRSYNSEAANWITNIPRHQWCRSHDEGRRYGHMTTNLAECINGVLKGARFLPITGLVKLTMYRLNEFLVKRAITVYAQLGAGHTYYKTLTDALQKNQRVSRRLGVELFDLANSLFEVTEPFVQANRQYGRCLKVNLRDRHCDCGEFQAFKLPCQHVIAACSKYRLDYFQFVDPVYRLDHIRNAYKTEFRLIGDEACWPPAEGPTLFADQSMLREKG